MSTNKNPKILQLAFDSRPVLTAYAYNLLKDWSLAQDVFQEAVIALNSKIDEEQIKNPISWMKRVIKNKSIDIIRKNERTSKRNEQISILLEKRFDELMKKERLAAHKQKEEALHNCMAKLTSDSRNILIAFYKSRFSCDHIADLFKKSTNAIRLTLSRSRSELRQCVKKQLEASE